VVSLAFPHKAVTPNAQRIAALIDHTVLRADASEEDVRRVCAEARKYSFASVCVNGYWVPLVASELDGSSVKVCSVAGFPLGAMATEAKLAETEIALRAGAHEIDMVINVGALKSGERDPVQREIASIAAACHEGGAILKVILETALLSDELKRIACRLSKDAGADFVKTSTGFSTAGAKEADVALMREVVGSEMGVKASGGIRTLDDLQKMVAAGATRIGASASVTIIQSAGIQSVG
jgi:deoxyribose-phosphate aldolase